MFTFTFTLPHWTGLDWTGLDWTGLDWTGLDWTGLDSLGLVWSHLVRLGQFDLVWLPIKQLRTHKPISWMDGLDGITEPPHH